MLVINRCDIDSEQIELQWSPIQGSEYIHYSRKK